MKTQLEEVKNELLGVHSRLVELFKKSEEIRKYYKYQNRETDSVSESFIIGHANIIGEIYGLTCDLDELIEMEREDEV
jgi:hypothetical protein